MNDTVGEMALHLKAKSLGLLLFFFLSQIDILYCIAYRVRVYSQSWEPRFKHKTVYLPEIILSYMRKSRTEAYAIYITISVFPSFSVMSEFLQGEEDSIIPLQQNIFQLKMNIQTWTNLLVKKKKKKRTHNFLLNNLKLTKVISIHHCLFHL